VCLLLCDQFVMTSSVCDWDQNITIMVACDAGSCVQSHSWIL